MVVNLIHHILKY